jgi:anti-sigma factor RsiW
MSVLSRRKLSCQELVELLTDYLDGAMPRRQRRALEAHLGDCANCTNYLEQFKTTIALTGRLRAEDIEPEAMDELVSLFDDWREGR